MKIIKIYENITDFREISDKGDFIKGVYKNTEKEDVYFVSHGLMSIRPGNAPLVYNLIMAVKFDNLGAAIESDYSQTTDFSVRLNEFQRFEVINAK
jgi:hypothetical protein